MSGDGSTGLTPSMEDYLEAILLIKRDKGAVRVTDISGRLDVKKASVTAALKTLSSMGLVEHKRYGCADLTDEGLRIAEKTIKRHDFLTDFLMEIGVKSSVAAIDACKMEHVLSEETFLKLKSFRKSRAK